MTDTAERQAITRVRRLRRLIDQGTGMAAVVVNQHPSGCAMSIQLVVEVDKGMTFSSMSEAGIEALAKAFGDTLETWLAEAEAALFEGDAPMVQLVQ